MGPYGWHTPALIVVLLAAIGLGGCGMGTTELPGSTQPGGPGFLSIITQQINDGVQGVSYATIINTSGGSGRLTACTVVSGTLPAGFSFPVASGSTCVLSSNGAPVTGAPGKYTFSLEAGDSSTPQRTDRRVYSLTIRPPFTVNAPAILDGVTGRSYTRTFTVTTNLQNHSGAPIVSSAEAGNGPITQCTISGLPGGFEAGGGTAECVPDSTGVNVTVTMKAPPGTLTAGSYPFTLSVTDSPIRSTNQTGVVAPASTATISPGLIVRQEFSVTQTSIAEAVQGRTYGVAPLAQGAQTSVVSTAPLLNSGEASVLGNGPLTSCTVTVSPADPALTAAVDPKSPSRCLLKSAAAVAVSGTYTVVVNATDSPIVDPASQGAIVVPANTQQEQLTWVVAPPLSYSLNFDTPQGQAGQVPDAVENRTYGSPPKTPVIVTATGGLSASTGLSIQVGGTAPIGIICATSAPNPQPPGLTAELVCGSRGSPVTAAPGASSFTISISDPGNAATPGGSTATDANGHSSHVLDVDPPLSLGVNLSNPLPPGVSGRSYGTLPSQPVLYSASGGLGGYTFATPAALASPGAAFPQGVACAQGSGSAAKTFACSASAITAAGSATAPYGPIPVTVNDAANATTPDGGTSGTTATQNRTLSVEPPLSITPVAGIDPPPAGVQGRSYGSGTGFAPLAYVVSGGDPPYTNFAFPASVGSPVAIAPSTPEGGIPTPVACASVVVGTSTEAVCSTNGANIGATPGAYPFQFSVSDTGSGETAPATIALAPRTITINAPLAWNGANPTSNAPPPGVKGRTYGGTGFIPLTFNTTGGIGAYSFSLPPVAATPGSNALPAGITCAASSGSQVVCSSGAGAVAAVPGAYSFSITVNDTADATTPGSQTSNTGATVTKPLAIEAPLSFNPTSQALEPAVIGRAYGEGAGCSGGNCQPFNYTLSGGLGGYQQTISLTNGISCSLQPPGGASYQCASAAVAGPAGTPVLNITATDTANASTPAGSASSTAATATATLPINAAMTITAPAAALPPAVAGRTYGSGASCSGGACQAIVFNIQGGLGGYSASATPSGFPGSFACPFSSTGSLSGTYSCATASGVSGTSPATLSVSASDTANAFAPTAQANSNTATLTIFPEITVTGPTTALPAAVAGRSYGFGSDCGASSNVNCQPIVYSVNGGLGGYSSPPTLDGYPGGFACQAPVNGPGPVPSANYTCLSTGAVSGPGSYTVGLSVADTANASAPQVSTAKASNTAPLTVDSPLALALSSGTPPAAVDQRAYGTGVGCTGGGNCAPISFTVSNGLGSGNYASAATVAAPTAGFACSLASPGSSIYNCSASPVSVTPTPTTPAQETLAVTASDVANASTPAGTSSGTSATANASLNVEPPFTLKAANTSPATAVVGRTYGSGSTCGSGGTSACQTVIYNAAGGLGTYQSSATFSTASAPLGGMGFACPLSGSQYNCSSVSVAPSPSITTPTSTQLTVTASDGNNASAPTQTASDNTVSLTVNPVLQLTLTPSSPPPDAVTGRSYGTAAAPNCAGGKACSPIVFTATFGTGSYTFPSATPADLSTAGFTCPAVSGATYSCTATNVSATAAVDLSTVSVKDVANASTPATTSPVDIATNLPVAAQLTIQQTLLPNALIDYSYGPTLTAQNGLGGYQWVLPGATPAGACTTAPAATAPAGLAASSASGSPITLKGPLTAPASAADTDFTFGICLSDTANQTTPAASALPNNTPQKYTVNVFNRYAFVVDTGTPQKVRVINTGESAVSPSDPGIAVPVTGPGSAPGDMAVTPNGNYAFVLLPATNSFDVIDTITHSLVTTTGFPSGSSCASPVGVAFSSDSTKAYFACGGSPAAVVELNITNVAAPVGVASATVASANGVPAAMALTPDGTALYVATSASTPNVLIYNPANLASTPITVTLTAGVTPVAIALVPSSPAIVAYVAEQQLALPGQVDVFSVVGTSVTHLSAVTFAAITVSGTTYNPEPSCLAVTPDDARVYVGIQGTDEFAVITGGTNTQLAKSPFLLPSAISAPPATIGASSPAGVDIPPLDTLPATGYRVFFTSINSGNGEVEIIDDTAGAPAPDSVPTLSFGSTSVPQAIANIPVPTAP